jgi:hypothetical protein
VLTATRGGVLLAVAVLQVGRAVSVACSPRIPATAPWLAGCARADRHDVWLLDPVPSATVQATDHALLAVGDAPGWAIRIDRVVGLAEVTGAGSGVLPAGWPAAWASTCVLAGGASAVLLDTVAIARELVEVAA